MSEGASPVVRLSDGESQFEHAIVETADGSECTIFPRECADDEIVTRWVTAEEGSYVPLERMQ